MNDFHYASERTQEVTLERHIEMVPISPIMTYFSQGLCNDTLQYEPLDTARYNRNSAYRYRLPRFSLFLQWGEAKLFGTQIESRPTGPSLNGRKRNGQLFVRESRSHYDSVT
jgi:hypothetical protein